MQKYLCLQRGVPSREPGEARPSPAEMQAMYAKFNEWRQKFQANLVDLGGRLGDGRLELHSSASDGPFVEVKDLVGGYMVVSASSLAEAIAIARECPGLLSPNSGVEVIEIRSPG
ncbi:MAG TPA: YciI family protein [Polyangiaceae bacterium]|nr:YciI family protein [Polyangiaceae bacterium]